MPKIISRLHEALVGALALSFVGVTSTARAQSSTTPRDLVWRREVRSADGVTLATAIVGGSRADTVIVPLGSMLAPLLRPLGDRHTLILYDLRSRGRSDAVIDTSRITLTRDVEDLEAVRRHYRVAKPAIIGWSYAGAVAANYAVRFPTRVAKLVLLNPIAMRARPYPSDTSSRTTPARDTAAERLLRAWDARAIPFPDSVTHCRVANRVEAAELIPDSAARARRPDVCALRNEWPANLARSTLPRLMGLGTYDWSAPMARLTVPTLVVAGDRDFVPLAASRAWTERPMAALRIVPGAGHYALLEQPGEVLGAIGTFLHNDASAEGEVRAAITRIVDAANRQDVDGVMREFAADAVLVHRDREDGSGAALAAGFRETFARGKARWAAQEEPDGRWRLTRGLSFPIRSSPR